jgi:hypothetical protein
MMNTKTVSGERVGDYDINIDDCLREWKDRHVIEGGISISRPVLKDIGKSTGCGGGP